MTLDPGSPVLALPGRSVQVGLARPTVLRRLERDDRLFLASLEGGRPATPDERARHASVIAALTRAGAWSAGPRRTVRAAVGGDAAVAGGVASALRAMGVRVRREPGDGSITVVAGLATADPALTSPLMAAATPHVVVLADDAGAWVSHVIVPGLTACTRCRDVALTRANPSWPLVSMQCVGRIARLNPLAESVAVARAAARVLAWLEVSAGDPARVAGGGAGRGAGRGAGGGAGGGAEHVGAAGTGERVDSWGAVTPEPLAPEPECGCGAAGAVGDELAARRARWK